MATTTTTPSELSVKNLFLLIVGCFGLCAAAAWLGSNFTMNGVEGWYQTIHKPSFNPPNEVFAPVWFALYTMMAVSLFYVLKTHHPNKTLAIVVFVVQLGLNALWSLLFFKLHLIGFALIDMIIMLGLMITYYFIVKPIRPLAAYLFIPYIAWVAFATVLTASIWSMN
ncbi:MAG: tryptophan-rich sensory protein [Cytophagaceae bacterium]|nr:tryptophan-rich sensory protein [Cytophagaceae bacterium]